MTRMTHDEQARALERAARPALAAIEDEARRAPAWLRPLYDACRELLFHPDLNLKRIQEAAGLDDPDAWAALGRELGRSPWSTLRHARLETAARLLLETEMSIAEAGYLVGYGSAPSFRHRLKRFLGMPPSRYRRRARRRLDRAGTLPEGANTSDYWRRMHAGELSGDEARRLDDYLGRLAGESGPGAAKGEDDARWARLRQTLAEGVADTFEILTLAEQRRMVREAVWFPGDSFFELLSVRSAEADCGRCDAGDPAGRRDRGVELALLAIDSLAANRMLETEPAVASLAWARLARARWRAGDLAGAEQDLDQSARDSELAVNGVEHPGRAAERARVAAAWHWLQGRRRQALDLARDSVAGQRAAGGGGLAAALVLRAELRATAAELEPEKAGERAGALRAALADLEEADPSPPGPLSHTPLTPSRERGDRTALEDAKPSGLRCDAVSRAAVSLRSRLLARVGSRAEISAALPQLRRAAEDLGPGFAPRLLWLEGHAAADPEPRWRDARERFAELGDELWVARTTLDLARLRLAADRAGDASALASELATTLGAVAARPEDLAALEPLSRAAPFTAVTASDLDRADAVLKRLEWQRRARRALDLAW